MLRRRRAMNGDYSSGEECTGRPEIPALGCSCHHGPRCLGCWRRVQQFEPHERAERLNLGLIERSPRISWDPEGQRPGIERQRVDCEALCVTRFWEIAEYFEDNDASAYSGKPRRASDLRE